MAVCLRRSQQMGLTDVKKIPLHSLHEELGAKFGPFAGFDMPLSYPAGIMAEHRHTREAAGLFDISHMLHVELSGSGAAQAVSRLCPYVAGEQAVGQARYSFLLNEHGGIIDDVIVTRLGETRFRIVCNAGCAQKDLEHISHHAAHFDAKVDVIDVAFLALQGPQSEAVLGRTGMDVTGLSFMQAVEPENGWFVSRTGYTGEDGFELAMPADEAEAFARKLLDDADVAPIGLGARDSLRLEAGLPLYGQDLSEDITPMEAGLAWAIPKEVRQDGDFVGAMAIAQKFQAGRARKRVGLKPAGNAPVRGHAELFDATGAHVGEVTSGGFGPSVGHPVAMGLVAVDAQEPFEAELRGKRMAMEVVKLPFAPHRYKRDN